MYLSNKIDITLEDYKDKLNKEQNKEIEVILGFKKDGILKKYEANYFIASILIDGNIYDYDLVDKEELLIISSNII